MHFHFKYTKESLTHVIGQTVLFSSIYLSVLCITIDRVLSVGLSFRYRAYVTKRKFYLLVLVMWIISMCMGAVSFLTTRRHLLIFWICFDIISAITIVAGYSYIIYTVHSQRRRFAPNCPRTRRFRYQVPLCIGVTFFCLWLVPDLILNINSNLYCVWILVLWHANIMFDPLVYVLYSKKRINKEDSTCSKSSQGWTWILEWRWQIRTEGVYDKNVNMLSNWRHAYLLCVEVERGGSKIRNFLRTLQVK